MSFFKKLIMLFFVLMMITSFTLYVFFEPLEDNSVDLKEQKDSDKNTGDSSNLLLLGGDVSNTLLLEENSASFYSLNGSKNDVLRILWDNGMRVVRIRIWVTNASNPYSLEYALRLAEKATNIGFKIFLDFHLSSTWADPGHQSIPLNWTGVSFEELTVNVRNYMEKTMKLFAENKVFPSFVQIGNEIECGVLWDYGRICDDFNNSSQWEQFKELLEAGINSSRDVAEEYGFSDQLKIVVHTSLSTKEDYSVTFYRRLMDLGLRFDVIGLSYYPWWHGGLDSLNATLWSLATQLGKDVMIVETAYPWTLEWSDNTRNIVSSEEQLLDDYPPTVEGQKMFLQTIFNITISLPEGKGIGVLYWEPEWIPTPSFGSPWENLALFDFQGHALNSLSVFAEK